MKAHSLKKLIYLFIVSLVLSGCRTTTPAADTNRQQTTVIEFGKALKRWSENKYNGEYELDVDKYANEKATVNCDLVHNLALIYPIVIEKDTLKRYDIDDYKTLLSDWFKNNENVIMTLKDIKEMSDSEMEEQGIPVRNRTNYVGFKGNLTLKNKQEYEDSVTHKEVYMVHRTRPKISQIAFDNTSASGKIKIDWSDLKEEQTLGGSLNYSPNWSGLSISYSWLYLMGSLDVGYNADHDKVTQEKLDMTNVLNYTKKTVTYDPSWYVTFTPSVYLKYFSVGCGVGCMFSDKTITGTKASASYEGNETLNKSKSSLDPFSEKPMYPHTSFMLRPTVKGYIPLNDEWFITGNVSYDYSFGIRIKNGMSFGLGFQYRLY